MLLKFWSNGLGILFDLLKRNVMRIIIDQPHAHTADTRCAHNPHTHDTQQRKFK